jgi:hypothetical protein
MAFEPPTACEGAAVDSPDASIDVVEADLFADADG